MTLWLARHAQPRIAVGTCYGALDIAADDAATWAAAAQLAAALPAGTCIVSSPQKRCVQLAQALSQLRPTWPAAADERLREMDFGTWEGRLWRDIGQEALDAWTGDFAQHRPGGGDNVVNFMERVTEAWDALDGTPTVWITHAGVIRAVALLNAGTRRVDQASQWPRTALPFGGWQQVVRAPFRG
jgi:alpha-ribazole phosphatase